MTLKQARGLVGWSQRQLAEQAGMSRAMVAYIEGGLKPSEQAREKLVRAFGDAAAPGDREAIEADIRAALTQEADNASS